MESIEEIRKAVDEVFEIANASNFINGEEYEPIIELVKSQLEAKDKEKFNLSLQIKTLKGVKKRLNEKNTKLKQGNKELREKIKVTKEVMDAFIETKTDATVQGLINIKNHLD